MSATVEQPRLRAVTRGRRIKEARAPRHPQRKPRRARPTSPPPDHQAADTASYSAAPVPHRAASPGVASTPTSTPRRPRPRPRLRTR
jgi:hypothetical protein